MAGGCAYGVAAYLLRRENPRLKWGSVALMGITAMQFVEGLLWLDGPTPHGAINQLLTICLIPVALLTQAWAPLFGSIYRLPVGQRRLPFFLLLIVGLTIVVAARVIGRAGGNSGHAGRGADVGCSGKFGKEGLAPFGQGRLAGRAKQRDPARPGRFSHGRAIRNLGGRSNDSEAPLRRLGLSRCSLYVPKQRDVVKQNNQIG